MSGFDDAVVVNRHVRWQLLSTIEQAELLANYPLRPVTIPIPTTEIGEAVDARFEQWLDTAYQLRHATDTLTDDPIG